MRVLVTGSSGLIGRWVMARLKIEGHESIGLDKRVNDNPSDGGEYINCDILNKEELISTVQSVSPEAVIHLAARIDLDETSTLEGYAANTEGVRNVIDAIRHTKTVRRVLYTSSQLVCRVGYVPCSEDDYYPNTVYGKSKVLTEKIVKKEDGGGAEWCLIRPTTVWGPHMSLHYQRMLRLIQKGLYFHCGNKKLYKSYAYAGNISYQYARMLTVAKELMHRKTFYFADYQPLSLKDYTDGLAREMGARKISTIPLFMARGLAIVGDMLNACGFSTFPFNTFRLNNILTEYIFDLSETESLCGPLPFTQEEGIRETVKWFLSGSNDEYKR